jgi:hypothetical protein
VAGHPVDGSLADHELLWLGDERTTGGHHCEERVKGYDGA